MRAAILLAMVLIGSGCESVRYGCFNACLGASGGYMGSTRVDPPDRSTRHCDANPTAGRVCYESYCYDLVP